MRILMTTDTVGGVWTFAKQLAAELLARGCYVAVVSVGRTPSPAQMNSVNALAARWEPRFLFAASAAPLEWMDENERAYSEAAPLLMNVAKDFGADLMVSSQYCFGALPFDGPKIVVAHSDVLSWAKACRGDVLPTSAWLERYRTLAREGLENADAVVAPTHWMLHALEENFYIPGELHVIYNGRSISHAPISATRRLQAVAAGRLWDEAKNLQVLADVALPLPLVIAGETKDSSLRFHRGDGDATFVGQLGEDEILALFRQSAIYVCPSKYEPFGLAPLEAALCGCAVVANNIPSLREIWGDAALFFDDAQSLSALLKRLSQNDWALMSARKQARWRASHFTASRMAEAYLELFRSILSREAGRYAA
jgi:glycogen(starch) synthase